MAATFAASSSTLAASSFCGTALTQQQSSVVARPAAPLQVVARQAKEALKGTKKVVSKAANKAVKATTPGGPELSKWYGSERRLYLPEGILDRAEVPDYLNGEVPGDYGFDPLGLSKKPQDFERYQANELIHARWAMLGALGFIVPEAVNQFGGSCGPEAVWWKTGALLLEGNTLQWGGITIPVNLFIATAAEIVLVGGAEYYRATNKSPLISNADKLHPGGPFDPFGLANDPEQFAVLKVKEIKNGRLAMFSMLGFFIQAYVTGDGPVANLSAHLSDPFGNNLITVLGGAVERAPTL